MAMIDYGNDVLRAEDKMHDALREHEKAKEKYGRQLSAMVMQSVALVKDSARLYEENGKLRELVQYMYRCFVIGHDWDCESLYCTVHVEEQMRELGFKEV